MMKLHGTTPTRALRVMVANELGLEYEMLPADIL